MDPIRYGVPGKTSSLNDAHPIHHKYIYESVEEIGQEEEVQAETTDVPPKNWCWTNILGHS